MTQDEITALRRSISELLDTRTAGQAVEAELGARQQAWQDRALIGSLRAGRAVHHYDTALADREAAGGLMLEAAGGGYGRG